MADDLRIALEGLLRKVGEEGDIDFLREGVRLLAEELMGLELSQYLGAERYERTLARNGQRNGTRQRQWDTRVGSVQLEVPRVRDNTFFPTILEPRKRAEQALVAVVQERHTSKG
jgi:putative transposase